MGGSSKTTTPVQTAQSQAALTGANTAASGLQGLGNTYGGQQQQLFNMLWGAPGGSPTSSTAGGSGRPVAPAMSRGTTSATGAPATGATGATGGGALGGFLNPANLNVTSPTGPFAGAFTNDKTQLAQQAAQNAEGIKSQAAQAGFGANSPSGMTADELRANNSDLANNVGNAFTTETGNSYNAALNNFWNAANAAQSGAATAQSGALGGTGAAASTYSNLYGKGLGQNTQNNPSALSNIMSVAGPVGTAAACVAEGTEIRLDDGTVRKVESLAPGDRVAGLGGPNLVIAVVDEGEAECVHVSTVRMGVRLTCTESHTLAEVHGGYVTAGDCLDHQLRLSNEASFAGEVKPAGARRVFRVKLNGTHSYLSGGIWSLE